MNIILENNKIVVGVKSLGAELYSVRNKQNDLEYMWSGDPAFWGKTSPILFPIVGTLKEDKYNYNSKTYSLSRHGFAREQEFSISAQSTSHVTFTLENDATTMIKYPFAFKLSVDYALDESQLTVSYKVENTGESELYFSIGAHPAFAVPLVPGTAYEDYFLQFETIENVPRWPISSGGLIEENTEPLLVNSNEIKLNKELFLKDALVLKKLKSKTVSLKHNQHQHGFDFHFEGFPFLGLWAAKQADFLCIEPWCGIADSVTHDQELINKQGIEKLLPRANWSRSWKVNVY